MVPLRLAAFTMGYKKSELSASQIVQSAIRVLARQGYARTSLLDIAREAGMSKGAVHYHFPSKESLIQEVLQTALDAVQARTIEAWTSGGDPMSSLRASIEALWEVRASRSDEALVVADLLAQSLYDDSLRPKLAEYYERAATQARDHLTAHLSPLGLRTKVSLDVLPRIIVGLLDGLVMQAFVQEDALVASEIADAIETMATSLIEFGPSK